MKFFCDKYVLQQAAASAARAAAAKSPIPTLEGLLIEAGASVRITGYDLKKAIYTTIDADIPEPGSVLIGARLFCEMLRRMPDGIVTVEAENGVSLPQDLLKKMINECSFAVSTNESRPVYMGTLFEIENNVLTMVSVDGYRLALRRWKSEEPIGRTLKFVVPAAALKEAEKILGDTDEDCTFFLGSKHILFTIGEATLVCRLLEGEFLDWRRVLPQNQPVKLAVNVAKMTDSIERVGLIISEKLKSPVRCKFGENTADFRSVSTIGEAHDVCQIAGDGQDMEIGFNCRYLLDALRAIPDAECSLELINGLSPIVMNPCDGSERYSYMVLPVRLKAGE